MIFIVSVFILGYSVLGGGLLESRLLLPSLIVAALTFGGLLLWRGVYCRVRLPRLGIDVFASLLIIVGASYLINGIDFHVVTRLMLWIAYGVLLYLMIDLYDYGINDRIVISSLIVVTGLINLLAFAETLQIYRAWWQEIDSIWVRPPEPFRFMSLFGYSSALMGATNLIAPFTLVVFSKTKKTLFRVGLIYWWLLYAFVIIGSSSRSGLLGVLIWITIFTTLQIIENGGLDFFGRFWAQNAGIRRALVGSLLIIVILGFVGVFVYLSSHSSHSGLSSGRDRYWRAAIMMWKENPWFGVGLGRYGLEYLRFASIPPKFWAIYAHSVPFQFLADLGIIGLVLFLMIVSVVAYRFKDQWQHSEGAQRLWVSALVSGVAAFTAQNLVDDFSAVPAVMIFFIPVLAIAWKRRGIPIRRWQHIHLFWLLVPTIGFMLILGWSNWAYQPLRSALEAAADDNWELAAQLSSQSAQRAPQSAFYQTEAGLAHARLWGETGDMDALKNAHEYFQRSVDLESTISVSHANLAMLSWYLGESDLALHEMQQAANLAPLEPVFLVNLGWFYEAQGNPELARNAYEKALSISPAWSSHPFWHQSDFRKDILAAMDLIPGEISAFDHPFLTDAWRAYLEGNWEQVDDKLQNARWINRGGAEAYFIQGKLEESQGSIEVAREYYEKMAESLEKDRFVVSYKFIWAYNISMHRREGFNFDLVPCFVRLDSDWGQFEVLDNLESWYLEDGSSRKAEDIRKLRGILLAE